MPGVRCHTIQRNKYFVVYSVNYYLLKCYGIHDIIFVFPPWAKMNNFVEFPTREHANI